MTAWAAIAVVRHTLKRWGRLSELPPDELAVFLQRVRLIERSLMLPVKTLGVGTLAWFLLFSHFPHTLPPPLDDTAEYIRRFFLGYAAWSLGAGIVVWGMDEVSPQLVERVVYSAAVLDAVMLSGMVLLTDGWESPLYWLYLALVFRNAATIPHADVQVLVNLISGGFYVVAGLLEQAIQPLASAVIDSTRPTATPPLGALRLPARETIVLRALLLMITTACCYAIGALMERQRRQHKEAADFVGRQQELEAAGRLAAHIAHQLKNPLGIINNAAYTLQRTVREGKTITQQIQIIREEVERSDRIITELMGYARLAEGRVERLTVVDELERAIEEAFPPGSGFQVTIHRDYGPAIPNLVGQRTHIREIFLNLLSNAREAMGGRGELHLKVASAPDYAVVVTVRDTGPGIAPEHLDRVFDPYFTTKEKGTGLGLAIVKHNTELYGGAVEIVSNIGKGTTFTVKLPARSNLRLRL